MHRSTGILLFCLIVSVSAFSQDNDSSASSKSAGLRKISSHSSHIDINIDDEALEAQIEQAVETALESVEHALKSIEINIDPIEINLENMAINVEPIEINIPALNINIEPIEIEIDDIDIDIDEEDWDNEYHYDDDHQDHRPDKGETPDKAKGLKKIN